MTDASFSPVPAGGKIPFLGSIDPGSFAWTWIVVDPTTPGSPEIKSLKLNGGALLVVADAGGSALVYEASTSTGERSSLVTYKVNGKAPAGPRRAESHPPHYNGLLDDFLDVPRPRLRQAPKEPSEGHQIPVATQREALGMARAAKEPCFQRESLRQ